MAGVSPHIEEQDSSIITPPRGEYAADPRTPRALGPIDLEKNHPVTPASSLESIMN